MRYGQLFLAGMGLSLAACAYSGSSDRDSGLDPRPLEEMAAGIWVDGDGCDHWIIDDGFEGYMSPRLDPEGRPVCREGAKPYSTIDFKRSFWGQ